MVHNTNKTAKHADENQILDETTWGHDKYGELGSVLVSRVIIKNVYYREKTVIVSNSGR